LTQLKLGFVKAATNSKPVLSRVGGIAGFHGYIAAKTGKTTILAVRLDQHLITRDWDKIKHLPRIGFFLIATVYIKLGRVTGRGQISIPAFPRDRRTRVISCDAPWNKASKSFSLLLHNMLVVTGTIQDNTSMALTFPFDCFILPRVSFFPVYFYHETIVP
jgi:hypothetical protein